MVFFLASASVQLLARVELDGRQALMEAVADA